MFTTIVLPGQVRVGFVVHNDERLAVMHDATAINTTVYAGGIEVIDRGGIDKNAIINWGVQEDSGSATGDTILSGGAQIVKSGGIASTTTVNSGGIQKVLTGGTTFGTITNEHGLEYASPGATANATTVNGGTLELASGASTGNAPVTFGDLGGILQLDASQSFHGTIVGFGVHGGLAAEIDLRDISFNSKTTLSYAKNPGHQSGTLAVTDGTHTAELTMLGKYSPGKFDLAPDDHGGTLVIEHAAAHHHNTEVVGQSDLHGQELLFI